MDSEKYMQFMRGMMFGYLTLAVLAHSEEFALMMQLIWPRCWYCAYRHPTWELENCGW